MKKHCLLIALTTAASLLAAGSTFAAELSLEDYLNQVGENSPGLRSARLGGEGYERSAEGAKVFNFPYLFGNYTKFDDRQENANPAFQGDRTKVNQYTVGLSAVTPIGLNARYSYNSAFTEIQHASAIPLPMYYTAYNKLELTQSLLKNGFGSEARAQTTLVEASNLAKSYANKYSGLAQLVQAESTYWRLAFARRTVEMQRDVLARAEKVLQWAKRRVGLQLGDKADRLQAQASYDLRRIELMAAEEEERSAARAFNNLRNVEGQEVNETLSLPTMEKTLSLAAATKEGTRLDVKAAEEEARATVASLQLDKERLKPTVDLFANLVWNGRDARKEEARSEAFGNSRSTTSLGVNFSVPLQVPAAVSGVKGGSQSQEAAHFNLEQKRLNETREWNDTQSRLADAKTRLNLLRSIEKVQREKYENEQQRLLRGRTTTYQALTFEQDYAATQLTTLRTQNEVLQLISQLKLFRGEQ